MLRTAALLGGRFAVTDLAVVLRRPVSDLAAGLQEAAAAGILAGSGAELVFRHPLIRQALYESMPTALRTALHAEAAQELAAAGADALERRAAAVGRETAGWRLGPGLAHQCRAYAGYAGTAAGGGASAAGIAGDTRWR